MHQITHYILVFQCNHSW